MVGILVVDGEPAICTLLDMFLRDEGFAVWTANTSENAVALFERHHESIQVVLLDGELLAVLPGLEKIKPTIRCCIMNASVQSAENALRHQTSRTLPKPFDLQQLRSLLHHLSSDEFFLAE